MVGGVLKWRQREWNGERSCQRSREGRACGVCDQWAGEALWERGWLLASGPSTSVDDGAAQWEGIRAERVWGESREGGTKRWVCCVWGDGGTSGYLVRAWMHRSIGQRRDPGRRRGEGAAARGEPWEWKAGCTEELAERGEVPGTVGDSLEQEGHGWRWTGFRGQSVVGVRGQQAGPGKKHRRRAEVASRRWKDGSDTWSRGWKPSVSVSVLCGACCQVLESRGLIQPSTNHRAW